MKAKTLTGVQIFAVGIIITSLFHIGKLICDHDIYFYYYADWGIWAHIRYAFSWFQRILGISIAIGLLLQLNWARIAGMVLGWFTIVTIYWKHPYEAFHQHTKFLDTRFGNLFEAFGFQNITFESLTIPSIIIHCLLDVSFWGIFIFYMTRPSVKIHFHSVMRGFHYRFPWLYDLLSKLQLGANDQLRFKIAASYLAGARSVIDVCAGTGQLRKHLPAECSYTAVDASPEFIRYLNQQNIAAKIHTLAQLEQGEVPQGKFDVSVMVVSLCQARAYKIDQVIETLKKSAKKCIIVEDVKPRPFKWIGWLMNYGCSRDYYKHCQLFTRQEFETLMLSHGYKINHLNDRYSAAVYESGQ